jgi:hypothetical protein
MASIRRTSTLRPNRFVRERCHDHGSRLTNLLLARPAATEVTVA